MIVERVEEMPVLGVLLDSRGSTEAAVRHNMCNAEKAIGACHHILFCRDVVAVKW